MRKCGNTVIMMLFSVLFLSACLGRESNSGKAGEPYYPEEYQVKNYADGETSVFGLNIAPADEMGDWALEWASGAADGQGFQYFIYADPDSWDVYLYYPGKQAEIQMLANDDVAVDYSESVLTVYVTSNHAEAVSAEGEREWLLHFTAPPAEHGHLKSGYTGMAVRSCVIPLKLNR